jgi:hypothetical protein
MGSERQKMGLVGRGFFQPHINVTEKTLPHKWQGFVMKAREAHLIHYDNRDIPREIENFL